MDLRSIKIKSIEKNKIYNFIVDLDTPQAALPSNSPKTKEDNFVSVLTPQYIDVLYSNSPYDRRPENQTVVCCETSVTQLKSGGWSNLVSFNLAEYPEGDSFETWEVVETGYQFKVKISKTKVINDNYGRLVVSVVIDDEANNSSYSARLFEIGDYFNLNEEYDTIHINSFPTDWVVYGTGNNVRRTHLDVYFSNTINHNNSGYWVKRIQLDYMNPNSSNVQEFVNQINQNFVEYIPNTDPYTEGGISDTGAGGDGNYDNSYDLIPLPTEFPNFSISTGFFRIWQPTSIQLGNIASWLWSSDLWETLKKMFGEPMDAIFGLHALPIPNVPFSPEPFKIGNVDSGLTINKATQMFAEVDCGTLDIKRYWGSALDYSPYTKLSLYLPYVGIVTLSADDCMQESLTIRYRINILTGDFICLILVTDRVLYHFTGNCAFRFPVSSANYQNVLTGAVGVGVNIGLLVATGGQSAMATVSSAGQAANNAMAMKPDIKHSGNVSMSQGWLDIQYPYLIIERARQSLPERNNTFEGYPSNATRKLEKLSGFTKVSEIHLENIPATDTELSEIEALLKEGVII